MMLQSLSAIERKIMWELVGGLCTREQEALEDKTSPGHRSNVRGLPMARGGQSEHQNCTGIWFCNWIKNKSSPHTVRLKAKRKMIGKGLEEAEAGTCSVDTNSSQKKQKMVLELKSNIVITVAVRIHQCVLYVLGRVLLGRKYSPGFSLFWETFIFTGFVEERGALSKWWLFASWPGGQLCQTGCVHVRKWRKWCEYPPLF